MMRYEGEFKITIFRKVSSKDENIGTSDEKTSNASEKVSNGDAKVSNASWKMGNSFECHEEGRDYLQGYRNGSWKV